MNRIDTAVILAAGKGTRMKHLTADRPKPMVEVGKQHMLERIFVGMRGAGIRKFVVVTGYHANLIEETFGDGARLGIAIAYVRQEQQTGTASALLLCRRHVGDGPFLMSWGDILVEPHNYRRLVDAFAAHPCDALLTVNPVDDPYRGAAVYVTADGVVEKIVEKPPRGTSTTPWNNAGVFVLAPIAFEYAARLQPSPRGEYELPEAIRNMIDDGRLVRALPLEGYWGDIGTPEDVERMERILAERETGNPPTA